MDATIAFYVVIALLPVQVTVLAALLVLWRKFHKLKQLFNNYEASQDLEKQRRSTDDKEESQNSYIAGRRVSSTLVRSNSNESVVWVPTPAPKRRSQTMDDDMNMTELMVVITDETNKSDIGFVNENFVSSPTDEVAMEASTTTSGNAAGVQGYEETAKLKVPALGSQLHGHGVIAGRKKRTSGSKMNHSTAETKTDGVTTVGSQPHQATAGTKASTANSRKNAKTPDTTSADSQHPTSTADQSIHAQQPTDCKAGSNDGYYDDGEDIYENQDIIRTVYNDNNNICIKENMNNNSGFGGDAVLESHLTSGVVQPVDEPIYVNQDVIMQYR